MWPDKTGAHRSGPLGREMIEGFSTKRGGAPPRAQIQNSTLIVPTAVKGLAGMSGGGGVGPGWKKLSAPS